MYKNLKKCFYHKDIDEDSIYRNRFESESSIHFDFDIQGFPAFFYLAPEVYRLVTEIHEKNPRFFQYQNEIPVQKTVLANCVFSEIEMSNEIEDIHSSRQELEEALHSVRAGKKEVRFAGQIRQYLHLISGTSSPFPENSQSIRKIYDSLLAFDIQAADPDDAVDGAVFRKEPVGVMSGTGVIHQGIMPEEEMIRILDSAIETLNTWQADPLLYAALFHFIFAYVHPFYNGNGRLARYLSLIKLSESLNLAGVLHLSLMIRRNRQKYYQSFSECEHRLNRGDLTPFVIQFLDFVNAAMDEGLHVLEEFSSKYRDASKRIRRLAGNDHELMILDALLVDSLFGGRGMTKAELAGRISKTPATTNKILTRYEDFIHKDTRKKTYRYFLDINKILNLSDPDS